MGNQSTDPSLHIQYEFVEGPWGGGNQFLKALRRELRDRDRYAEEPSEADVVLFNSFNRLDRVVDLKQRHPHTPFIHRVDGPISKVRGYGRSADSIIFRINRALADATVYQSRWSKRQNRALGMPESPYDATIMNAPDPRIFNREGTDPSLGQPPRLIATSWSDNPRKGFDVYQYLDRCHTLGNYEMTFVGNAPVTFKNIEMVDPVPSEELAGILKRHDIFVTASRNDPCSNSLIEALHCGLPAVALDDGGHPEIVGDGGVLFDGIDDVVEAIKTAHSDYDVLRSQISLPSIAQIGTRYLRMAESVHRATTAGDYNPARLSASESRRLKRSLRLKQGALSVQNFLGQVTDGVSKRLWQFNRGWTDRS